MENFRDALLSLTGAPSIAAIAKEIDVPRPTFNRQVLEESIPIRALIDITRAYGLSILDLLAGLGLITVEEARKAAGVQGLDDYTTAELSKEVYERTVKQVISRDETSPDVPNLSDRRRTIGEQKQEGFKAAKEWTEDVPED